MLILLPPSEGKAAPTDGEPLDLETLAYPQQLGERRVALLDALERLVELPQAKAVKALGISKGQAGEVTVDAELRQAPTAPAADVYAGVLYDRLGLAGLPAAARKRVLIASALWGVVRPDDRIPYYRFSAKARLDGIGPLSKWWRDALAEALPDRAGQLVVDMRSGVYASAWQPQRATLLGVRAFSGKGRGRKPVTHMAKAVRGEVARALLEAKKAPEDPEGAAAIAAAAGFEVDLADGSLDVIVA